MECFKFWAFKFISECPSPFQILLYKARQHESTDNQSTWGVLLLGTTLKSTNHLSPKEHTQISTTTLNIIFPFFFFEQVIKIVLNLQTAISDHTHIDWNFTNCWVADIFTIQIISPAFGIFLCTCTHARKRISASQVLYFLSINN